MGNTTNPVNYYLYEPILGSELVLINNSKKLKEDPSLLNETSLDDIERLRDEYIKLEARSNEGEVKLRQIKKEIRDKLRDLSFKTYTNRDRELFGTMITTMTKKIITRPQFSNYTFKDEMQSLAIQYILLYTHKFDPYRQSKITGQLASSFAYISTIIFNACIATINKFSKEQAKAKEDFLETQKMIHKEPNISTYGPEHSVPIRVIKLVTLEDDKLLPYIKSLTIKEETEFWIPANYKLTSNEYNFILKYQYNISIRRLTPQNGAISAPNEI